MKALLKAFNVSVLTLCLWTSGVPISMAEASSGVAKVIILKGQASVLGKDGKTSELTKDMWIAEGSKVSTGKGSFVKLLFIDKSTMNIAQESQMEVSTFPKNEAGVITLLKGEIRSKVTKNYMDMKEKDKSKLFIKTNTAAMGVRGTDFIVGFQPQSGATSLDVISGAVAMAKIDSNMGFAQNALEKVVSSPLAVMVNKGFSSQVNFAAPKAAPPAPIPPAKLEGFKANENAVSQNSQVTSKDVSQSKGSDKNQEKKSDEKKPEQNPKSPPPPPGLKPSQVNNDILVSGGPGRKPDSYPNPNPQPIPSPDPLPPSDGPLPPPDGPLPPPDGPTVGDVPDPDPSPPPCNDMCACYNIGCALPPGEGPSPDGLPPPSTETAIIIKPTTTVNFNITTN